VIVKRRHWLETSLDVLMIVAVVVAVVVAIAVGGFSAGREELRHM
jgi:hypothetical protein